ncbi:MarR family transcriptional regulator [Desemzia sp. RIT804]|uniref:MarR family winged helix-turn-helix transcriptional regulator n=1 Tax=Desemzia sp. RIT 804 TaxID=2810209 RepID=UPI00194DC211|nr:MarR family transcriptional regulator [Desemzia sp. RIT 804]MBM6614576.1 MarR family transcriptional regulator [Desemzia sp. RIT 804]
MSEVLREIGVISRSLGAISNTEFKDLHLNKDQYLYITRIYETPGIINDTLAELVIQDRTTVAKSVRKLATEGLIRKEVDHDNKKIRRLYVTEKGAEIYDFLRREELHSEKQAMMDFTDSERAELLRLLGKMKKNVAEDWHFVKSGNKRIY